MIDKLFYIIYNSYYKHGSYKNDTPPLTVFGIFTIAFFSVWGLIVDIIHWSIDKNFYIKRTPHLDHRWYILGGALITYFLFYYNKRYKDIYLKYKDNKALDSRFVRILGFVIVIFFIFVQIIVVIVYEKFRRGDWKI
jgi:hypothetical protein